MISIAKVKLDKKTIREVDKVLRSGILVQGQKVKELEEKFIQLCGTKYAIATNNGTSALHAALYAAGIGPGDEVITTPFTFVASANSILMVGAKPVFVDIKPDTFNLNPNLIEKVISKKTKAILAVNLYGQPADYKEINSIAKKHDLIVMEDAAQSINSNYFKRKSGNLADIATFSLYATKNIMSAEGGMITTNNRAFAKRARLFRHHGQSEKNQYEYLDLGYNYRLTDIQATIALGQLERVDEITTKRQNNAKFYTNALENLDWLETPYIEKGRSHVFHQYTLKINDKNREKLISFLQSQGVQSKIFYPIPLYRFPQFDRRKLNLPVVERVSKTVLSLPVHPLVKKPELNFIIKLLREYEKA
jgi:dTDP-4-amino-4,6-dideoxygalactose transaminase